MTFGEFPGNHESTSLILQLRGLPYNTTNEEIYNFLEIDQNNVEECEITCTQEGKPSGEAFLQLSNILSVTTALQKHKKLYPNTERYVDIYQTNKKLMSRRVTITWQYAKNWDGIIRLRNLKPSTDIVMVQKFFKNLQILENGIFLPKTFDNFGSGECFVEFAKFSDGEKAIGMDGMELDGSNVEIRKSSNNEFRSALLANRKLLHHATKWGPWTKSETINYVQSQIVNTTLDNFQITQNDSSPNKKIKMEYKNAYYNQFGDCRIRLDTPACNYNEYKSDKPMNEIIYIANKNETTPVTKIVSDKIQPINFKKFSDDDEESFATLPNGVPILKPDPHCEYRNIVVVCNITPETESEDIRKFLKPAKAIAYWFKRDLRQASVAMESHEACISVCENKHLETLKNSVISMILKSEIKKN